MTDPLATLLRLRRLAADQARRDLAAALAAEQRAAHARMAASAAFAVQAEASPTEAAHPLAGAYAAWLPAGQSAAHAAAVSLRIAEASVSDCRDALAHARAAERAVDNVQKSREAAARIIFNRKQQAALDDI